MKKNVLAIAGIAMLVMAGCSSKSTVTPTPLAPPPAPAAAPAPEPLPPPQAVDVVPAPVLGDVFFDFDKSSLAGEAQEQLKQNALWMEKNAAKAVTIEGHCDERGTAEYNIALGERRALSAKQFLVNLGISETRISTVSFGEERPFDPGHNEEAWAKNRRAHFLSK